MSAYAARAFSEIFKDDQRFLDGQTRVARVTLGGYEVRAGP